MLKFSIGIPAYNQGVFLEETIYSLLNQDHKPFEIVVSNNHSTDNTQEVLDKFKDQIKIISPNKLLPVFEHFNFLVNNMTGEWFTILSSDDIAQPHYVRVFIDAISQNENAVLIRSGYNTIDKDSKFIETKHILSAKEKALFPENFIDQLDGPKVSFAAFAVKIEIFKKVGGFPENLNWYGDWGLWLKLSPHGDFIYQKEIISQYRVLGVKKLSIERQAEDIVGIYDRIALPIISEHHLDKISTRKKILKYLFNFLTIDDFKEFNNRKKIFDILNKSQFMKIYEISLLGFLNYNFQFKLHRFKSSMYKSTRKKLRFIYQWLYKQVSG